jgi:hypothetical protein
MIVGLVVGMADYIEYLYNTARRQRSKPPDPDRIRRSRLNPHIHQAALS